MNTDLSHENGSKVVIRKDLEGRKKVQTAEGWRRSVLKMRAATKSHSSKK